MEYQPFSEGDEEVLNQIQTFEQQVLAIFPKYPNLVITIPHTGDHTFFNEEELNGPVDNFFLAQDLIEGVRSSVVEISGPVFEGTKDLITKAQKDIDTLAIHNSGLFDPLENTRELRVHRGITHPGTHKQITPDTLLTMTRYVFGVGKE